MIAALFTVLSTFAPTVAEDPRAAAPEPDPIRVEFRVEPFLDLWFAVRAAGAAKTDGPEFLARATEKFRAADREFGSPLAWGPLEARLVNCKSAADARKAFADLPETSERRNNPSVALRARALELADALALVEADFREKLWPADQKAIEAVSAELGRTFRASQRAMFEHHGRVLGFDGLQLAIPCVLLARAPAPGAITHRGPDGLGVCFVAVEGSTLGMLSEIVLHEATHALDVTRDDDLFDALRARILSTGVARSDRLWRDAPHTVMFCASAATVRAVLDPKHVDYGEESGYYARIGATASAVRGAWAVIVAQELDRPAALERLVAATIPSGTSAPAGEKPR